MKIYEEYKRVAQMMASLTFSFPMTLINAGLLKEIDRRVLSDKALDGIRRDLYRIFAAIKSPEDYDLLAQAYELYVEASFWLHMEAKGIKLDRTEGTGKKNQKRPDFSYTDRAGTIYFEVKALEMANPLIRRKELAAEALENAAELDARARSPGVHVGDPLEVSGPLPDLTVSERIDAAIEKIANNIKIGQITLGGTVLVVDMGRFAPKPYGPSNLVPVFFYEYPDGEACVSGELWQIGFGRSGEQIFTVPEFEGACNRAGHQAKDGIFTQFENLMAIMFMTARLGDKPEVYSLFNNRFDQTRLKTPLGATEDEVSALLSKCSDGFNDAGNSAVWHYRASPLR